MLEIGSPCCPISIGISIFIPACAVASPSPLASINAAIAADPAAGMAVFGYGFGLFVATRLTARWERANETLIWAHTEDARLLGRRSRIAPFATTGPAAGQVRPVVKGAARSRG